MDPSPDRRLVRQLAELARIDLDAADAPSVDDLVEHLREMLAWIEQLDTVDVDGVEPLVQPVDIPLRLRPDVAMPASGADAVLGGAPARAGDCFVVPRIIGDVDDD